jgi:hypothetical protein
LWVQLQGKYSYGEIVDYGGDFLYPSSLVINARELVEEFQKSEKSFEEKHKKRLSMCDNEMVKATGGNDQD